MIVPMKKLTILCLEDDTDATLETLRELGVLHLLPVTPPEGTEFARARQRLRNARSLQVSMEAYRKKAGKEKTSPPPSDIADEERIMEILDEGLRERKTLADRLDSLRKQAETMSPFGAFEPAAVRQLSDKGIIIRLFQVGGKKPVVPPENTQVFVIQQNARGQHIAIVGREPFDFDGVELPLPESSLDKILADAEKTEAALQAVDERLTGLSLRQDLVRACMEDLEDEVRYTEARAGAGAGARVAYVQGFCPVDGVDGVRKAASEHGWGSVTADPADDDPVPTLIRNPAWVRPIKSLFALLDIFPGYREVETRSAFMLFFTIFFAILVGDAGYGLLFLLLLPLLRAKFKSAPPEPFRLMTILSVCTVAWGAITGNWFGIEPLPAFLRGFEIPWMKDEKNLMVFSFLAGVIHLSVAQAWKALQMINSTRALGQAGWIAVTWFMYFLARFLILGEALPGWAVGLLVTGVILVALFMTPLKHLKKEWADHVMLPFDVIGNFSDLVSYVRLFAVGSAGLAVAVAINELAVGEGITSVGGGVKAALILVVGHVFNIVLCMMSVLVHGVRLNTLEFSRHVGLEWSGFKYEPFARCSTKGSASGRQ